MTDVKTLELRLDFARRMFIEAIVDGVPSVVVDKLDDAYRLASDMYSVKKYGFYSPAYPLEGKECQ